MRRRRNRIRKWLVAAVAAGALGVPAAAQARPLMGNEFAYGNDGQQPVLVSPRAPTVTTTGGFDWADAGVGAGIAVAALLGGTAIVLVSRHRGRLAAL